MPSTSKHGTTRGLPIKEVLEYLLPELDLSCLRLALNTPKVTEQLMKLDEQGVGGESRISQNVLHLCETTYLSLYRNGIRVSYISVKSSVLT